MLFQHVRKLEIRLETPNQYNNVIFYINCLKRSYQSKIFQKRSWYCDVKLPGKSSFVKAPVFSLQKAHNIQHLMMSLTF